MGWRGDSRRFSVSQILPRQPGSLRPRRQDCPSPSCCCRCARCGRIPDRHVARHCAHPVLEQPRQSTRIPLCTRSALVALRLIVIIMVSALHQFVPTDAGAREKVESPAQASPTTQMASSSAVQAHSFRNGNHDGPPALMDTAEFLNSISHCSSCFERGLVEFDDVSYLGRKLPPFLRSVLRTTPLHSSRCFRPRLPSSNHTQHHHDVSFQLHDCASFCYLTFPSRVATLPNRRHVDINSARFLVDALSSSRMLLSCWMPVSAHQNILLATPNPLARRMIWHASAQPWRRTSDSPFPVWLTNGLRR
jgi:hypothetical protein